jgi:hypothetical protein
MAKKRSRMFIFLILTVALLENEKKASDKKNKPARVRRKYSEITTLLDATSQPLVEQSELPLILNNISNK